LPIPFRPLLPPTITRERKFPLRNCPVKCLLPDVVLPVFPLWPRLAPFSRCFKRQAPDTPPSLPFASFFSLKLRRPFSPCACGPLLDSLVPPPYIIDDEFIGLGTFAPSFVRWGFFFFCVLSSPSPRPSSPFNFSPATIFFPFHKPSDTPLPTLTPECDRMGPPLSCFLFLEIRVPESTLPSPHSHFFPVLRHNTPLSPACLQTHSDLPFTYPLTNLVSFFLRVPPPQTRSLSLIDLP